MKNRKLIDQYYIYIFGLVITKFIYFKINRKRLDFSKKFLIIYT